MLMNNYTARMIFPTIIHEYLYDKIDEKEAIDFCYRQKELDPQGKVLSNRGVCTASIGYHRRWDR